MTLPQSAVYSCNLGKVRAAQGRRMDKMSVPLSPAGGTPQAPTATRSPLTMRVPARTGGDLL
jgi:hypothetical protein